MSSEIRNEILKYLKSQGINKMRKSQIVEKFERMKEGGELTREEMFMINSMNVDPVQIPRLYDMFDCETDMYNYRIEFLKRMARRLSGVGNEKVAEGGIATGLDICFLAKHFPNISFEGYDENGNMVEIAKERAGRLSLKNISFYEGKHEKPRQSKINMFDLLYIKNIECVDMNDPREVSGYVLGACERIRNDGTFVLCDDVEDEICEEINATLSAKGIIFIEKNVVSISPCEKASNGVYAPHNHIYRVERKPKTYVQLGMK